jgi:hypothetical protein
LRIMSARGVSVMNCEPVLFMLMPDGRCEDHHVDGSGALTILGLPHYRDADAPRP